MDFLKKLLSKFCANSIIAMHSLKVTRVQKKNYILFAYAVLSFHNFNKKKYKNG